MSEQFSILTSQDVEAVAKKFIADLIDGNDMEIETLHIAGDVDHDTYEFDNELGIRWNVIDQKGGLLAPMYYFDTDGVRVDVNIFVNIEGEVVEFGLVKYEFSPIKIAPSITIVKKGGVIINR